MGSSDTLSYQSTNYKRLSNHFKQIIVGLLVLKVHALKGADKCLYTITEIDSLEIIG